MGEGLANIIIFSGKDSIMIRQTYFAGFLPQYHKPKPNRPLEAYPSLKYPINQDILQQNTNLP
jgi:hypothetical protein